jgi:hypothetical protein
MVRAVAERTRVKKARHLVTGAITDAWNEWEEKHLLILV